MSLRPRFWCLLLVCALGWPAQAAYLRDIPQEVAQPDGTVVHCFASGDEYFNWLHDRDGFPLMRDPVTGRLVYVAMVNGEPQPTSYAVGAVDPQAVGLQPGRPLSAKTVEARRARLLETVPSRAPAPTTGTINNLVIFIRFSGEAEFTEPISTYANMHNTTTAGANSLRNYYQEVSYGALTVSTTFYPLPAGSVIISYQDTQPRNYYRPYHATTNPTGYTSDNEARIREHTLLRNAVNAVAAQVPAGLVIDGDGDGLVDNICFIVSGNADGWSDLLWPHQWALWTENVTLRGKRVWTYNFQLQIPLQSSGVGVLAHEFFHTLGAPDLYHYSYDGLAPVGQWDLMEYNQNPPQHMLTYMKMRYGGWIAAIPEITAGGVYTLSPVTSSTNNCYKIASPNSASEYFVVEYRRKTGTFENSVPGSGLIVYRINTAQDGEGNRDGPPDEVYVYRPGGTLTVNGTPNSAYFSAAVGRTAINDTTNPSSFLSNGSAGGLDLFNIGSAGETLTFYVGGSNPRTDLWIRNAGDFSYIGNDIYNEAATQTKTQRRAAGSTAVFQLTVQNDGVVPDTFAIRGPAGAAGWAVRYYDALEGGTDITDNVTSASGWVTPSSLAAGLTRAFRMEITPDATVAIGTVATLMVTATAQGSADTDAVYAVVRFRGALARVSETVAGIGGNGDSDRPALSADGNFMAFSSQATNLLPLDTNGAADLFVAYAHTGELEWASLSTAGALGNGASTHPAASADGRYVAFVSEASNLVAGDTNLCADIFLRDRVNRTTTRVSVATGGAQADGPSQAPAISGDGRYIAFASDAANLVPDDTNGATDIFVYDRVTGTTRRVSVATGGAQADGAGGAAAISGDGRYVAFASDAANLVPGDTNGATDIFVHNLATGETTRVSLNSAGSEANAECAAPALSADGRYVVFESVATNLDGDTAGIRNIYVRDRAAAATARASLATAGVPDGDCFTPVLSADGRFVAFESAASNLVDGDTNAVADLFVRDRVLDATARVSLTASATEANDRSAEPALSANGRYLAFSSRASNLVDNDVNGRQDVFLRERVDIGPLTGLTLETDVASPRLIGTSVSLTVLPQGGYELYYRFRVFTGSAWITLQEYARNNRVVWTPDSPGNYTLEVWAIESTSPASYDAEVTLPFTITAPPLTAVSLAVSPAGSAPLGEAVTLTAAPTGGGNVEYRFFQIHNGVTTTVQAYGTANTCTLTPAATGAYQFIVWAREQGSTAPRECFASRTYTITSLTPLTGVSLAASPAGSTLAGRPITLTATAVGGESVEYRFFRVFGGVTTTLQPYTVGANTLQVTPDELGQYQFIVWAREQGSTRSYDCYASVVHKVNPPLSAVALTASPGGPKPPGTALTLKATPTGGGQVQYRFYVAEPGGPLQTVQAYGPSDTCLFTITQQGTYQFLVYAREVGSNRAYDVYKSITYTCVTPITGVTLTADPPSPGTVDTPITLTAQADGGFQVQYRYFVQPPGGAYETIQHYAVGATTCQYTPTAPGRYTFLVWVRETGSGTWNAYKTLTYMVE